LYFTSRYASPFGEIYLAGEQEALTGLWFEGQKYFGAGLGPEYEEGTLPVLEEAKHWLDLYFQGRDPGFTPKLLFRTTPFREAVWNELLKIPYGQTVTYGEIAERAAGGKGSSRLLSRAVGNAVGHNPVSLIVPCHRVVGADGSLPGYAGGIRIKRALLMLERGNHY
jgi:methylated-DNA-[protein]-cysteine S-methyltransferase